MLIRSLQSTRSHACRMSCINTSQQRWISSSSPRHRGTFKDEDGLQIYHERKILPYTPKQLYSVVADTGSYQHFIPFVTSSKIMHHEGPGRIEDQPWLQLKDGEGDVHAMQHHMQIKVMGFDEAWQSNVTCEKYRQVSATSDPSNLFKHLKTTWTFEPAPSNSPHPSASLPHEAAPLSTPGQPASSEPTSGSHSSDEQGTPTLVSLDLSWQFKNPLYAMAASGTFQKVSSKIMDAFEKRVRTVHGQGPQ